VREAERFQDGLIPEEPAGGARLRDVQGGLLGWRLTYGVEDVLKDIYEHNVEQWQALA
jgi:hypothetical protein